MALTKVTGSVIKDSVSLSGNVSIGGTLTYEDVTNIDSVGIITARSTIDAQGSINLADSIIHTGDTDTKIRFPAANTVTVETAGSERLRIASDGNMGLGTNSLVGNAANVYLTVNGSNLGGIALKANGTTQGYLQGTSSLIRLSSDGSKPITFDTAGSERVRIASDGDMGVGTNSPSTRLHVNGGDGLLVERSAGTSVAGFKNTGASAMNIYFRNTGSTNHPFIGSSNQDLTLGTNNSEKIRITNGGLDPSTDGATDLGNSSKRFRDLYLSSGIFLGGTTSSNELEDYEEGTYVPSTNTGLTLNSGYNTFSYIKIGRCCTVRGLFFPNNNPSGGHNMTISLPFASYNYTGSGASIAGAGGSGVMYRSISGADAGVAVYVNDNSSTATFYKNGSNGGAWSPVYNNDWNSGLEIYVDFTYFTV